MFSQNCSYIIALYSETTDIKSKYVLYAIHSEGEIALTENIVITDVVDDGNYN